MLEARRRGLSLSKPFIYFIRLMWHLYIIKCVDKSFYVGITSNLERRFREHKEGRGGKYTLHHKPIKIVYSEDFNTKQEALRREKQIKGWSHRKKEDLLIN